MNETPLVLNRESDEAKTPDPEAIVLRILNARLQAGYESLMTPVARYDQLSDLGLKVNEALQDGKLDDAARERIVANLFSRAHEARLTTSQYFVLLGGLTLNRIPRFAETRRAHPIALAHSAVFIVDTFPSLDRNEDTAYLAIALTRYLLSHRGLPAEAARRLCEAVLTRNPGELGQIQVQREALRHPECPIELLEQAAWSPHYLYREAVRLNPNCPEALRVAASLLDDTMDRYSLFADLQARTE